MVRPRKDGHALPPLPSVIDSDRGAALTWVQLAHVWTYRNPEHPMTPQQVRRVAVRAARKIWHIALTDREPIDPDDPNTIT